MEREHLSIYNRLNPLSHDTKVLGCNEANFDNTHWRRKSHSTNPQLTLVSSEHKSHNENDHIATSKKLKLT